MELCSKYTARMYIVFMQDQQCLNCQDVLILRDMVDLIGVRSRSNSAY